MADVTSGTSSKPFKNSNQKSKNPGNLGISDPDALQESMLDIWGWMEKNAKLVAALVGVLILVGIAALMLNWLGNRQEKKAQEAYYAIESKYTKLKEGYDRAKYKAMMPAQAKDEKTTDQPASGDLGKDYGSVIPDLEKLAHDEAGTAAGAQAALLAADAYMTYHQPDKAAEIASIPAKAMNSNHLLAGLARMQWGSALAAKGDCKQAVTIWQQVLDNKAQTYLHGDANLRSGLCYEAMNEPQKAMDAYQKVSTGSGEQSTSAQTAKGLLRALQLKNKPAAPAKQG